MYLPNLLLLSLRNVLALPNADGCIITQVEMIYCTFQNRVGIQQLIFHSVYFSATLAHCGNVLHQDLKTNKNK